MTRREDRFTSTHEDAARYEAARGQADDVDVHEVRGLTKDLVTCRNCNASMWRSK